MVSPFSGGEPAAFAKRDGGPACLPPLADGFLQPFKLVAGVGNSLDEVVRTREYRQVFAGYAGLPQPPRKWTVMVYMVGGDLEARGRSASREVQEMLDATLHPGAAQGNLVLSTGGAARPGWDSVRRVLLQGGQLYPLQDLGAQSMATPEALADFVTWAGAAFPAEHYALVLWGNGNGPAGYGLDASPAGNGDTLDLGELRQAFQSMTAQSGRKLDLVAYDTGLMGVLEVAQVTVEATDKMAASPAAASVYGLDYIHLLANLPAADDGAGLARLLVDGYLQQAKQVCGGQAHSYGLFDLNALQAFNAAFAAFSAQFKEQMLQNSYDTYAAIGKSLAQTPTYAETEPRPGERAGDRLVVDLNGFLAYLAQNLPALQQSALALQQASQGFVPYSAGTQGGTHGPVATDVGSDTSYIPSLPPPQQPAAQDLADTMDAYWTQQGNDGFDPFGEPTDPNCPPGEACAPILFTWLHLDEEDILGVDGYYGQQAGDSADIYLLKSLYRGGADVMPAICPDDPALFASKEKPHCLAPGDACRYQLCVDTDCRNLTVLEDLEGMHAEVRFNGLPAQLSFCAGATADTWLVSEVMLQAGGMLGRREVVYPGDRITPISAHLKTGATEIAREKREGTPLVTGYQTVTLRRDCTLTMPTVYAGYYGLNENPQFNKLCASAECTDPENVIGFELLPY